MNEDLKQGQRIKYDVNEEVRGTGTIVGKATNNVPILGGIYIIQPDIPINNGMYNYSHFVLPENQFELID
jgi:hypothetical protein